MHLYRVAMWRFVVAVAAVGEAALGRAAFPWAGVSSIGAGVPSRRLSRMMMSIAIISVW